jgi:hypothetical protein
LGEQDGLPERDLKSALKPKLEELGEVERAYLARIGFGPSEEPSVALCLAPTSGRAANIVQSVGEVFSRFFSPDAYLDVIFVAGQQEADLRRVCRPFFSRPH